MGFLPVPSSCELARSAFLGVNALPVGFAPPRLPASSSSRGVESLGVLLRHCIFHRCRAWNCFPGIGRPRPRPNQSNCTVWGASGRAWQKGVDRGGDATSSPVNARGSRLSSLDHNGREWALRTGRRRSGSVAFRGSAGAGTSGSRAGPTRAGSFR